MADAIEIGGENRSHVVFSKQRVHYHHSELSLYYSELSLYLPLATPSTDHLYHVLITGSAGDSHDESGRTQASSPPISGRTRLDH